MFASRQPYPFRTFAGETKEGDITEDDLDNSGMSFVPVSVLLIRSSPSATTRAASRLWLFYTSLSDAVNVLPNVLSYTLCRVTNKNKADKDEERKTGEWRGGGVAMIFWVTQAIPEKKNKRSKSCKSHKTRQVKNQEAVCVYKLNLQEENTV